LRTDENNNSYTDTTSMLSN